jgi:hypothetical protein
VYHPAVLRRALIALLVGCALPATATSLSGIRAGETLRVGERRVIGVGLQDSLGARANEAELVLSLDGGRTFALRVSPEFDSSGNVSGLVFTVPNLLSPRAVLGLRAGRNGEGECLVAVSEHFVVVASPSAPLEPLRTVRGELATREASEGRREEEPGPGFGPVGSSLTAAPDEFDLEDGGEDAILVPSPSVTAALATGRSGGGFKPPKSPESFPLLFLPLRE